MMEKTWPSEREHYFNPVPRGSAIYWEFGGSSRSQQTILGALVGEDSIPYVIFALWAVNSLSIVCWDAQ